MKLIKKHLAQSVSACSFAVLIATTTVTKVHASDLELVISGQEQEKGEIVAALFDSSMKNQFPKGITSANCVVRTKAMLQSVRLTCENIEAGNYALLVFHDTNSNGLVDHSFLGFPKERIGMSSGCRGRFGPPRFDQCKFLISVDNTILRIELR